MAGFTAINRPRTVEGVQPVESRLPQNVGESQDSCNPEQVPENAPGLKARKPLTSEARRDDGFRISKSNCWSTKVNRAPRWSGKENVPPSAGSARGSAIIDRLADNSSAQPSREITAKLKEEAAPATKARTAAQKAQPRKADAMTGRERALTHEATLTRAVSNSTKQSERTHSKSKRSGIEGQQRIRILPEHVAEVMRRSDAIAKIRAAEARARVEQQKQRRRGNAYHVVLSHGEPSQVPWMGVSQRKNMHVRN